MIDAEKIRKERELLKMLREAGKEIKNLNRRKFYQYTSYNIHVFIELTENGNFIYDEDDENAAVKESIIKDIDNGYRVHKIVGNHVILERELEWRT